MINFLEQLRTIADGTVDEGIGTATMDRANHISKPDFNSTRRKKSEKKAATMIEH